MNRQIVTNADAGDMGLVEDETADRLLGDDFVGTIRCENTGLCAFGHFSFDGVAAFGFLIVNGTRATE